MLLYLYYEIDLSISAEVPDERSIRLVGGSSAYEGQVEMYVLGHWVPPCFSNWDLMEATVVCRQLGYPAALAIQNSAPKSFLGTRNINMWLLGLQCTGNESSMIHCSHERTLAEYCPNHLRGASVICSG